MESPDERLDEIGCLSRTSILADRGIQLGVRFHTNALPGPCPCRALSKCAMVNLGFDPSPSCEEALASGSRLALCGGDRGSSYRSPGTCTVSGQGVQPTREVSERCGARSGSSDQGGPGYVEFALAVFERFDDKSVCRVRPIWLPSVEPQRKTQPEEGDDALVSVGEGMVHDDGSDELTVLRLSRIALNELKHSL